MQQVMGADKEASGGSVTGLSPVQFIEANYRKTELRRLYRDKEAADHVGKLMRTIEQDVIPRLVSARRDSKQASQSQPHSAEVDADRVERFARILVGHDVGVDPASFVSELRAEGFSVEVIYLSLLAPAARHVGAMWDDDQCTFVDVTMALGTLHRMMLTLSADFRFEHRKIDPARRVLLVQPPGSTHTFGLQMVAEFFKRGAWSVDMLPSATDEALGAMVRAEWFTVIGFSVACDPGLGALTETIRLVRSVSANPAVGIMVGGPAFVDHPELVRQIGADRMAADAIQAVIEAERFVLHAA